MNKLEFKAEGNSAEIKVYGDIGDNFWKDEEDKSVTSVADLEKFLTENKNLATIDIYINSNGGSVFDGIAMYNMLKRHKAYKRVYIDGFACSIASVIAMVGNKVVMPKTSMMMIHNPWTIAMGNSEELRKIADDLDMMGDVIKNAYMSKVNIGEDKLSELMNAESFLTAEQCFEYGFCTQVGDETDGSVQAVETALNQYENLYANKLANLESIKNAIRSIDETKSEEVAQEVETLLTETLDEEVIDVKDEVIETEEIAEEEVGEVKANALKKFFGGMK